MKHLIRFQSPEIIHKTFLTCCVLHNLLLDYDGCDNWEYQMDDSEEDINAAYGTFETLALKKERRCRKNNLPIDSGISRASYRRNGPGNGIAIDMSYQLPEPLQPLQRKRAFHERRSILLNHFCVMKKKRLLHVSLR